MLVLIKINVKNVRFRPFLCWFIELLFGAMFLVEVRLFKNKKMGVVLEVLGIYKSWLLIHVFYGWG